ncbi:MAG: hypothetical protein HC828_20515 [Blastochloris sp.]|nr:hypothetical protein [Blastochloris sp.]
MLEALAARQQHWSHARVAVPSVLLFTVLTLGATLLHIDRFHLSLANFAWYTVALTWVWIAVYALVPLAMSLLCIGATFVIARLLATGDERAGTRCLATPLFFWHSARQF